jgi:hypothetical protein
MKKVYIGIPSRTKGFWHAYTALLQATQYAATKGIMCAIDPHVGASLICRARTNITWKFLYLNPECDYFMQLDDDVQLPYDALVKLVEADKNIVGGMYALKTKMGKIAIRSKKSKPFSIKEHPDEVMEINYLSGGCILQKREVVQKAWDHYKDLRYLENSNKFEAGYDGIKLQEKEDDIKLRNRVALYQPYIYKNEYLSEDWAYCQRMIDMGEKVWLHTGVKCSHWGLASYGIET